MKMNKATAVITAGLITFGAMFSASASGIGYVNTDAVMHVHPKMERAQLDIKNAGQSAQENFEKRTEGKPDQEKQRVYQEVQRALSLQVKEILRPIQQDVINAIQQVRKDKNLDVILDINVVIDGGSDVTPDVVKKLEK